MTRRLIGNRATNELRRTQRNAEEAINGIESDATALAARVTVNEGDISTLQTDVSANTSSISSNDTDISALQDRADDLEEFFGVCINLAATTVSTVNKEATQLSLEYENPTDLVGAGVRIDPQGLDKVVVGCNLYFTGVTGSNIRVLIQYRAGGVGGWTTVARADNPPVSTGVVTVCLVSAMVDVDSGDEFRLTFRGATSAGTLVAHATGTPCQFWLHKAR